MKKEYWDVSDAQVIEKTGKSISVWMTLLSKQNADNKKSTELVNFLQTDYDVPRYWARTLTTLFLKSKS